MLRTYLEFFVSRLFGTGVDTFILWICETFLFTSNWAIYVLSPIISFEFAVISNFFFSYFWIWGKSKKGKSLRDLCQRFVIFNLSSIVGFLIKMVFLLLFAKLFGWNVIICNLVALLVSGIFNFFADFIIFHKRPSLFHRVPANEGKLEK